MRSTQVLASRGHPIPMDDSSTKDDLDPALAALNGCVLDGRYKIDRLLGTGGMGAVFEATHIRLDRKVAIKVLRPVFVGHEEFIRRFLREAKATSKIHQRNVVEILDYGEAPGGIVYSVMELLHGQDLGQLLAGQPEQRLPWNQACGLLAQIAAGLKAAHAHGVIHRDIKPANCFLSEEDDEIVVKVVDFGIAKDKEAGDPQRLTGTGEILGTPAFIAPELVLTTNPADARSDVYSLGVLAYRMLTGRLPFSGDTPFELLHRTCFDEVVPLHTHVPELPPAVDDFVLLLLAKDPNARPQDMGAVRERLSALAQDTLGMPATHFPATGPNPAASAESGSFAMRTTPLPLSVADLMAGRGMQPPVTTPTEILSAPASSPSEGAPEPTGHDETSTSPQAVEDSMPAWPEEPATRARRHVGWIVGAGLAVFLVVGGLTWLVVALSERPAEPEEQSVAVATNVPKPAPATDAPTPRKRTVRLAEPEPVPAPTQEPEPTPDSEPTPEPEAAPEPAPPHGSGAKRPASPTDASIIRRLEKDIRTRCPGLAEDSPIQVSFLIQPSGQVLGLTASPSGVVGNCAMAQVKGASFSHRAKSKPITFTIP